MATIADIISTFTEEDLNLTVPLDLQDVSESDLEVVNTYNSYLSSGDYSSAITYRNEHPELEKYILDVKKYNILQAFVMNAYLYAKSQKQQCEVSATEPVDQVEGDIWYKEETTASGKNIYIPYLLTADGYVEFSIGANIVDNLNSDDADSALSAKQGKLIQEKINAINNTLQSFNAAKSDFVSSGLGKALGLTSSSTWADVTSAIIGVSNKGAYSKTFTPSTSKQTVSSGAGYYSGISLTCNAVSLSGNAAAANVLSGNTFYNTSLTKQTGTMANRSSTIQTATTSTSDQTKSCYRINGSNIEVAPAIGYWGSWDWTKSCIKIPANASPLTFSTIGGRVSGGTQESPVQCGSTFTAPENGKYVCVMYGIGRDVNERAYLQLRKNNSVIYTSAPDNLENLKRYAVLLTLNKGETISVFEYNTYSGGYYVNGYCTICYIG